MIGSLRGILLGVSATGNSQIHIEVDGVGYRIVVGQTTLSMLQQETAGQEPNSLGPEVFIYTSHQVREDSEILYGFMDIKDRDAFEILLKIHKVGPAMAKDILDCYNLEQLQDIVIRQDVDALVSISGVGKTTAERLIGELKNKLQIPDIQIETAVTSNIADVKKALLELGYSTAETRTVLNDLPQDGEVEELLKHALTLLVPADRQSTHS